MGPHQGSVEGKENLPRPAGHTLLDAWRAPGCGIASSSPALPHTAGPASGSGASSSARGPPPSPGLWALQGASWAGAGLMPTRAEPGLRGTDMPRGAGKSRFTCPVWPQQLSQQLSSGSSSRGQNSWLSRAHLRRPHHRLPQPRGPGGDGDRVPARGLQRHHPRQRLHPLPLQLLLAGRHQALLLVRARSGAAPSTPCPHGAKPWRAPGRGADGHWSSAGRTGSWQWAAPERRPRGHGAAGTAQRGGGFRIWGARWDGWCGVSGW